MKRKIQDSEIVEILTFLMHKMEHDVAACAIRYTSQNKYELFCPSDYKVTQRFEKTKPKKDVVRFMIEKSLLKRREITYNKEQVKVLIISELGKNFINNCNRIVNE